MKALKQLFLAILTITFMVSCGGEEKKESEEKVKVKIGEKKAEKKVDDNPNNVVITADDFMKYNKTEIRVKAGQKVKITLRHIGKMNAQIMGHNVVVLNSGVDPIAFAASAATSRDTDYIPEGSTDVIAHTKMIGGGETAVIEFDAPAAGTYDFLCSFPGHYAMMKGKFIVE